MSSLTAREREVASLLAKGTPNKVIGRALCIQPATVKVHVDHILKKLDVHNRTEAALELARHGF